MTVITEYGGFPDGSDGEESACNAGGPGLIPGLGRYPGEGNDYPLQYSCLEDSMDKGDWLQSMGLQRVGQDWVANTHTAEYPGCLYFDYWCSCVQLSPLSGCRVQRAEVEVMCSGKFKKTHLVCCTWSGQLSPLSLLFSLSSLCLVSCRHTGLLAVS